MAESGESSPNSAAATEDAHHEGSEAAAAAAAAAAQPPPLSRPPPPPPSKVRLMVSYGGRIQPRPHDNQLAYVNGETKILSLERPLVFADFAARLVALAGNAGDVCVKYQLPGEDLDALVSVTNDEDLEHLVLEYDRLHLQRPATASSAGSGSGSSRGGSTLRLRVFLFPVMSPHPPPPPPQPAGLLEPKAEQRHWFVEALNTVPLPSSKQDPPPVTPQQSSPPQQHKQESVFAQQSSPPPQAKHEAVFVQQAPPHPHTVVQMPPPPQQQQQAHVVLAAASPDYLFGLDNGFVPPPAVKVKDPAGDPPTVRENVPVEIPPKNDDRHLNPNAGDHVAVSPVVSPAKYQRQIQELEKLQVADNATHQPPPPAAAPAPAPAPSLAPVPVPAALPRNGSDDSLTRAYPPVTVTPTANAEYYIPKFPEKPPVPPPSSAPPATAYLQVQGRYASVAPGSGADHGPVFFIPAPHGYFAATASPGATSYPAVYAVAPPSATPTANGSAPSPAVSNATAYAPAPTQVAYDSNGRAIYYTSMLPQYPSAVNGMSTAGAVLGTEPSKPVAVKPTVS